MTLTKQLMIGAAIGALTISGALSGVWAQSPNAPSNPNPAATSAAPSPSSSSQPAFVTAQKPEQWLASKFKGTDVLGADGQKVGDISDILFDKSGKIEAYVISVGGFLGVGAKEVALAPNAFEAVAGTNGLPDKLKTSMTLDQLKNAQNFARYEPPRAATTGSGLGNAPTGMGVKREAPPATGR